MQLVGPQVGAVQALMQRRCIDIAFIHQQARRGRVIAQRILNVVDRRQPGPGFPGHTQLAHRCFGVFFTFGDDADKVADDHHATQAGDLGDRSCVRFEQRVADEVAVVGAGVWRPDDPAMQHARNTLVVNEDQLAGGLGRNVQPRHRAADDSVISRVLYRRIERQCQYHMVVSLQAVPVEPGPGLRRSRAQRHGMHLNRRAGDRGALVGCGRRVAQQHLHARQIDAQFFGDDLRQRGGQAGAQVDMAVQPRDAAVVAHSQQNLDAFGRIAWHCGGLAFCGRQQRRRVAHHQQHAACGVKVLPGAQRHVHNVMPARAARRAGSQCGRRSGTGCATARRESAPRLASGCAATAQQWR